MLLIRNIVRTKLFVRGFLIVVTVISLKLTSFVERWIFEVNGRAATTVYLVCSSLLWFCFVVPRSALETWLRTVILSHCLSASTHPTSHSPLLPLSLTFTRAVSFGSSLHSSFSNVPKKQLFAKPRCGVLSAVQYNWSFAFDFANRIERERERERGGGKRESYVRKTNPSNRTAANDVQERWALK